MNQNKKIVKYKKPFRLNIGMVVFAFIFIYLIFNIYAYMTTTHISVYEVSQGTIAENNVYRGLILRDEQVYHSDYSGSLNYYVKEASKVGRNMLVYSVDESGNVAKMLQEAGKEGVDADTLAGLEEDIVDFLTSYQSMHYYNVYTFKDNIDATLDEALNLSALESISDYAQTAQNYNTFHTVTAASDGIVVYYTDGYETVTLDNFNADMFDESSYTKTSSRKTGTISAGSPAYKLITSERWNVVIPVSTELAEKMAADTLVEIRFLKDEKTMYVNYSLMEREGKNYLVLELQNSMIRYAKDRFLEIELLLSEETGLKVPNSAITEKEFYTIPADFFITNGDSNETGVLVEQRDENGEKTAKFVAPTIYYETDEYYYIDSEQISSGAKLIKTDANQQYTVGMDTALLQGVYNINKGYAIFKQIDILYQSEEYSIVKTGTAYGISLYDHIALDGTKITENELIHSMN